MTEEAIKSMEIAVRFKENDNPVTSMDVHYTGSHVATASEKDRSITLLNCNRGSIHKVLNSKKYGVGVVRLLSQHDVLHTATISDNTIRLLSMTKLKYVRYYQAHTDRVYSVAVTPKGEYFLSSGRDRLVYIWESRFKIPTAVISLGIRTHVAVDREGTVFATASGDAQVRLYDMRNYRRGPFALFDVTQQLKERSRWTGVKFSPKGEYVMVTTDCGYIMIIDTTTGKVHRLLTGYAHKEGISIDACFLPDSNYVFSGSEDGKIYVWNIDSVDKIGSIIDSDPFVLNGRHRNPCRCVVFNPTYALLVSACKVTYFWLPEMLEDSSGASDSSCIEVIEVDHLSSTPTDSSE